LSERFFAPCPRGLELLLLEDVAAAGGSEARQVPGGAEFAGAWECCYRLNLQSRIATRVLWRLGAADYRSEDDLYRFAAGIDWPRHFAVERKLRIYVTAQRSPVKSIEFVTLRIKDAICDRFRAECGQRPSIDTKAPDVRVHLFLTDQKATLYLDTSGEPLWHRGHKIAKVAAPLKENLAAGILRLAGWKPGVPLLDPLCGSGTFLLEAAQMSLADAPGLGRDAGGFGFERLRGFKQALWQRLLNEAAAERLAADRLPIWGSDLSADAVARARQNLAHAGIDDLVSVEQADLLTRPAPAPAGILVFSDGVYEVRMADGTVGGYEDFKARMTSMCRPGDGAPGSPATGAGGAGLVLEDILAQAKTLSADGLLDDDVSMLLLNIS